MSLSNSFRVSPIVILGGLTAVLAQTLTYAERLGWPPGTKAVILHVDAAGRSHSFTCQDVVAQSNQCWLG